MVVIETDLVFSVFGATGISGNGKAIGGRASCRDWEVHTRRAIPPVHGQGWPVRPYGLQPPLVCVGYEDFLL